MHIITFKRPMLNFRKKKNRSYRTINGLLMRMAISNWANELYIVSLVRYFLLAIYGYDVNEDIERDLVVTSSVVAAFLIFKVNAL